MTPAEVVTHVLGVRQLARDLDVSPSTVIRWKDRGGNIPSKYHQKIIELSNGELDAEALVYGR